MTSIEVTRRQVLQVLGLSAAGAAGAGALGACSPGKTTNPTSSGGGGGGGGGAGSGEFHGAWPYSPPPQGSLNLYSTSTMVDGRAGPYGTVMHMPSCSYMWAEKTYEKWLVDDYKLDSAANTYTLKVKGGVKWSDDSPLTSKDFAATFYIAWLMSDPIWSYVSGVETPDDQTVILKLKEPSSVLERYILKLNIADNATYGTYADKAAGFQKAGKNTDDAEVSALLGELQKFQPEKQLVTGPYMIDMASITNTQMTLVKNPKSAYADAVKFDKIVLFNGETPVVTPLVQNKTVDYATHGFPPASEKAFQAAGIRIIRPPNLAGPALLFNLATLKEFNDVRARQAIAYIIDRNVNGTVSLADSGKGVKYMAGFSDNSLADWLPSGIQDKLQTYEVNKDTATKLLQDAGWTKSGNAWKTKEGKEAKYTISFPNPYADWSASAKNVASQLTEFGITVTPQGVDDKQAPIDIDKGNFELGIQAWGSSSAPHPYFAYKQDLLVHNIPIAKNNGGKGMGYELGAVPGVDGKPVNLEELITQCGAGLDIDKQKTYIGQLAQIFNAQLPMIPLFERYGNNAALEGVRVKAYPADDDPILKNPVYADNFVMIWMLQGKLLPN